MRHVRKTRTTRSLAAAVSLALASVRAQQEVVRQRPE